MDNNGYNSHISIFFWIYTVKTHWQKHEQQATTEIFYFRVWVEDFQMYESYEWRILITWKRFKHQRQQKCDFSLSSAIALASKVKYKAALPHSNNIETAQWQRSSGTGCRQLLKSNINQWEFIMAGAWCLLPTPSM